MISADRDWCCQEYSDYDNDYESTLYPPAIIYDPYEKAKDDFATEGTEGRYHFGE